MISGAGMLDSLACHSPEKLVMDAEAIASAQRLTSGIVPRGESLAAATLARVGHRADFLRLPQTRSLFRLEQHVPSEVIDRAPLQEGAPTDAFARARTRVAELLEAYQRPPLDPAVEDKFHRILARAAKRQGVELPVLPEIFEADVPAATSPR
jgi:trimethylamine--corrinoid protein Co-methyltransferase